NFYGMISSIDENLGKLRDYLKAQNLERNTIFIFMTDNGTADGVTLDGHWSNGLPTFYGYGAGMRGKKASPYDGGHRVPCFIHWSEGGLDEGRDFSGLSAHIDILPSLMGMCGLERANGPKLDGLNLWPYLKGE